MLGLSLVVPQKVETRAPTIVKECQSGEELQGADENECGVPAHVEGGYLPLVEEIAVQK